MSEITHASGISVPAALQEKVLVGGDLSKLSSQERLTYIGAVCNSLGLNPLTRPFEYINLSGKLTLYARKDATEQLRSLRGISIEIVSREVVEDTYVVTARAVDASGRRDESIGAVSIGGLKGDAKANAIMKAETKAKRRVTLSISGLGLLDETEIETIPGAQPLRERDITPQKEKPEAESSAPAQSRQPAVTPPANVDPSTGELFDSGSGTPVRPLDQQGSEMRHKLLDDPKSGLIAGLSRTTNVDMVAELKKWWHGKKAYMPYALHEYGLKIIGVREDELLGDMQKAG